ncbi:hypothetical protein V2J09_016479 [Rumex salicifolius]
MPDLPNLNHPYARHWEENSNPLTIYLESRRLQFMLISAAPPPQSSSSTTNQPIQTPLLIRPASKAPWLSKAARLMLFGVNSTLGYMLMLAS